MTVPGNIDALLLGGQRGYQIERSLRFNSADSAYLSKTPTTPTNNLKWTFSCWVKRSALGANSALFDAYLNGTNFSTFYFTSTSELQFYNILGGVDTGVTTTGVYRDLSAWYHIVFVFDSANATAADRAIIYVNGTRPAQTNPYGAVTPSEATYLNNSYAHSIGRMVDSGTYLNGYLTETYLIDGQALTPSSFGETDTITGVWKPKRYSGTYGTNGFYLKFADNSGTTSTTLGKDSSGNGNNWTPNNFSVTAGAGNDSMIDTPTPYADGGNGRGNYCTLNGAVETTSNGKATLSNGNLECSVPRLCAINGSFGITSGKWYWEVQPNDLANSPYGMGVFAIGKGITHGDTQYIFVDSTGYRYTPGDAANQSGWGPTYNGSTDIIGLALDADARTLGFNKNGGSFTTFDYSSYSSMSGGVTPAWKSGGNLGTSGAIFNFGARPFAGTPPSGYKALNTQNLPEPTIKKPGVYFNTVLYTGTGTTNAITGVGFQPDFVWGKRRSGGTGSNWIFDAVRGAGNQIVTNNTNAEVPGSTEFASFDSDGFTVTSTAGSFNVSGSTYVAWCWDESATPGFDIVTYTGNGTNRTIAHSLGVAPKMMIVKNRTTAGTSWAVYTEMTGAGNYLRLNSTIASTAGSTFWNSTAPTSSVFSVGTDSDVNANTNEHVAYLWSEVAGFSKFGSYTGNGSSDGPFVFCGFRPRWIMIKNATLSGGNWRLFDTARQPYNVGWMDLYANDSTSETAHSTPTTNQVDVLSNGFKLRDSLNETNRNGDTLVFAAFAESAAKYSLAR